ncbi:MAG: MATE family efflux transporter [Oligoflexales bacterium]
MTTTTLNKSRVEGWRRVLNIAWPLIVANSFWNLQLTIDRVFLGNFSTDALGAAIAVMGVFWTPMALVQQTAAYLMTFVAQYYGAKRNDMIGVSVWQAIYISIAGGLLFLLLIPLADPIFELIGHSENLRPLETAYFKALCYSALPTALVAVASAFFTGLGNSRMIIGINCAGFLSHVLFDYLMIFGNFGFPRMGIAGGGYATVLANWTAAIYGLFLLFSRKNEQLYAIRSSWKVSWDLMKRFFRYGLPSGLQWALEGLAFTVFLIFVGNMPNGDAALASSGIIVTVMMLAALPAMGVAQAVSVLVGQHLGEKDPDGAESWTWSGLQVAAMYIAAVAITFLLFPNFYLNWFHNAENASLWAEVSVIVPYLLMFVALFTIFDSMNLVFSFALKGAGDTRFVTLVALFMPWPLMILPTWLAKAEPQAVYLGWGAASCYIVLQALVFWRRFVGAKWKQMSVIN